VAHHELARYPVGHYDACAQADASVSETPDAYSLRLLVGGHPDLPAGGHEEDTLAITEA
jgi:hypothetical protein